MLSRVHFVYPAIACTFFRCIYKSSAKTPIDLLQASNIEIITTTTLTIKSLQMGHTSSSSILVNDCCRRPENAEPTRTFMLIVTICMYECMSTNYGLLSFFYLRCMLVNSKSSRLCIFLHSFNLV